jgi:NAD(P)-dependent dehydrogenase (short-subunit alcohol dehydrogenase family)
MSIALITGGGRGIGKEVARQLAADGMTVYIAARDPAVAVEAAADVAPNDNARPLPLPLDVSNEAQVRAAAEHFSRDPARLDVLVNNAAAFVDWTEMGSKADLAIARDVMETNLFGAWRMIQAFLPLLRESEHPRIVNVSSGGGSHGDDQFGLTRRGGAAATYGISKAALNALTSTLAAELADTPIVVNSVCPGLTATWPGAEDMGARPIAEGAASVAFAATLDDAGPRGGFFRDGEPLPW